MQIQEVTAASVPVWRALRLRALAADGHAFGATHEGTAVRSDAEWQSWLANITGFIAIDDAERPVGMAGVVHAGDADGVVELISMWVDPAVRGSGVGDALVQAAVARARRIGARRLILHVVEGNAPALGLYERNGFRLTGGNVIRERDGAIEHEMALAVVSGGQV